MGTPFITQLEPSRLDGYNPRLPHDKQPSHIPVTYRDAMSVREAVFVKEQGCPARERARRRRRAILSLGDVRIGEDDDGARGARPGDGPRSAATPL